jgi:hypothetical protein
MSHGRHSKPRPPRSDTPVFILVALLALGVAATPLFVEGVPMLRVAVAGLALLCLIALFVAQRSGRRQIVALGNEVDERSGEIRALRIELARVHLIHSELAGEVIRLRDQITDYVVPVPIAPEPIYPSLHLPLVRAAFAEELPPVTSRPSPLRLTESANVEVQADAGSDTVPSRQLLDLTASEIARLRRASSA